MSEELFSSKSVAGDSPRLRWIKAHEIKIQEVPNVIAGDDCPETGDPMYPFYVWIYADSYPDAMPYFRATGYTLDEALANLALKRRWLLWNQEQ